MKLTVTQRFEIRDEMVNSNETKPVRFLTSGQALNITTGELSPKSSNVIYHPVYWNFSKSTAEKIAEWLGVKPIWSK